MFILSDELRLKMVDMTFAAGYASPEDSKHHPRWTKKEMLAQCDDEGLLSLFIRYTTGEREIEREALEQIAVFKMLA
jgi:hypothetical protein